MKLLAAHMIQAVTFPLLFSCSRPFSYSVWAFQPFYLFNHLEEFFFLLRKRDASLVKADIAGILSIGKFRCDGWWRYKDFFYYPWQAITEYLKALPKFPAQVNSVLEGATVWMRRRLKCLPKCGTRSYIHTFILTPETRFHVLPEQL